MRAGEGGTWESRRPTPVMRRATDARTSDRRRAIYRLSRRVSIDLCRPCLACTWPEVAAHETAGAPPRTGRVGRRRRNGKDLPLLLPDTSASVNAPAGYFKRGDCRLWGDVRREGPGPACARSATIPTLRSIPKPPLPPIGTAASPPGPGLGPRVAGRGVGSPSIEVEGLNLALGGIGLAGCRGADRDKLPAGTWWSTRPRGGIVRPRRCGLGRRSGPTSSLGLDRQGNVIEFTLRIFGAVSP